MIRPYQFSHHPTVLTAVSVYQRPFADHLSDPFPHSLRNKTCDAWSEIFNGFARNNYYGGEFGMGTKMKFVANLLVTIHNVAATEAFVLGMKAGLNPNYLLFPGSVHGLIDFKTLGLCQTFTIHSRRDSDLTALFDFLNDTESTGHISTGDDHAMLA